MDSILAIAPAVTTEALRSAFGHCVPVYRLLEDPTSEPWPEHELRPSELARAGIRAPLLWVTEATHNSALVLAVAAPLKLFDARNGALPRSPAILAACDAVVLDDPNEENAFRAATHYGGKTVSSAELRRALERNETPSTAPLAESARLNVLFLYCEHSTHIRTVRDYLESFSQYSRHRYYFVPAVRGAKCPMPLEAFDAVFLHYSVRLSFDDFLSPEFAAELTAYAGWKAVFIQDEYEQTETARRWIERLGLRTVFTVVPPDQVERVYPPGRFGGTRFHSILTGYVPDHLVGSRQPKPMAERSLRIAYRGRPLHYVYGDLGQEKQHIGVEVRRLCEARGIPVDIDWTEESRIYGDGWFRFLESCRATLGTESGANVFDEDGSLRRSIDEALEQNPELTYAEARERYLQGRELAVAKMNQISPKMFEAIALGTALVLFEGNYSGVLEPEKHYLPLKKDYSNFDAIAAKLEDVPFLEALVRRAREDILESGRYGYRAFVALVESVLESEVRRGRGYELIAMITAVRAPEQERWDSTPVVRKISGVTTLPVHRSDLTLMPVPARVPEIYDPFWIPKLILKARRNFFGFLRATIGAPFVAAGWWLWRKCPPRWQRSFEPIGRWTRKLLYAT